MDLSESSSSGTVAPGELTCLACFRGYGHAWLDRGGAIDILSLSDISSREGDHVTHDSSLSEGFVVTTPAGIWWFRWSSFWLHFLDAYDLQNFGLDSAELEVLDALPK